MLLAWKRKVEPEMSEVHSLPADATLRPHGLTVDVHLFRPPADQRTEEE